MNRLGLLCVAALTLWMSACSSPPERVVAPHEPQPSPDPEATAESFQATLQAEVVRAEQEQRQVLVGRDGFLFFVPELRSLTVGDFWGEAAAAVSRATDPEAADPLPCILDFAQQLRASGIRLLLVPVPAKASVYPDRLPMEWVGLPKGSPPRLDGSYRQFFNLLEEHGVELLDLLPIFLAERETDPEPLYCRQDTHWSPRGAQLAARLIAGRLAETASPGDHRTVEGTVTIQGDLWRMLEPPRPEQETLRIRMVGHGEGAAFIPVQPSRDAPVLLLGDSHNLVFHAGGDLHTNGAGLPEHLARELGQPVDLVAVRGSGATPSRVNLLRRGDSLRGKSVVIWCLSVREFTESAGGWRPLQIIR